MLKSALEYVERGWPVFPVGLDKKPRTSNGFKDATSSTEAVKAMDWSRGIGIATGKVSGLLVLDLDVKAGQDGTASLAQRGLSLPPTVMVITPSGGEHHYFAIPDSGAGCKAGLLPGVDIRADGGYVVAPPTPGPVGGMYRWATGRGPDDIAIAPAPAWLLDLMSIKVAPVKGSLTSSDGYVPIGKRNDYIFRLAAGLVRKSLSPEAVMAAVWEENQRKCVPPLPRDEVEKCCASAAEYESTANPLVVPVGVVGPAKKFDVLWAVENRPNERRWIIPGWISQRDIALVVGPPGVGKSYVLLDLACSAACGAQALGMWDIDRSIRRVAVVDVENDSEVMHERIYGLAKARGFDPGVLSENLAISDSGQALSFRFPAKEKAIMEFLREHRPDLVIMDSVVGLSDIVDENNAVEVRRFFDEKLTPIREAFGCAVICVHHTNKAIFNSDNGVGDAGLARGSGDFSAAASTVLLLKPGQDGDARIISTKVRRGPKEAEYWYRIEPVGDEGIRPVGWGTGLSVADKLKAWMRKHLPMDRDEARLKALTDVTDLTAENWRKLILRFKDTGFLDEKDGALVIRRGQ